MTLDPNPISATPVRTLDTLPARPPAHADSKPSYRSFLLLIWIMLRVGIPPHLTSALVVPLVLLDFIRAGDLMLPSPPPRYLLRQPERDLDLDPQAGPVFTVVAASGAAHDLRCDLTPVS